MKSIDEDYTINFYASASAEFITTYTSSSVADTIVSQSVTESVVNNYNWTQGTGSIYAEWAIISGTSAIGTMNPNNADGTMNTADIGKRIEIRGDEIYTNMYAGSGTDRNRGIVIYKSSSVGYVLHDYVNIPTSSVLHATSRTYIAREFSLDKEHFIVPLEKASADSADGELQIYKSSSSGWALAQTLNKASYNDNAAVIADTGEYLNYWNSIIKNDLIFANGFAKVISGGNGPARYVALFRSSSSGFQYEDQVQITGFEVNNEPGNNNENGGRIGNSRLNFDFDGTTGVVGSKHANGSWSGYLADNGDDSSGRVRVIKSGSSGWYSDANLGLESLGKTGSVDASWNIPTASGGQTYPDWYTFQRFGLQSCAVSGSFIAATAIAKGFYAAADGKRHWRKDTVFIMQSGSTGWSIVAELEDPDTLNFTGEGSSVPIHSDSGFGHGLVFGTNSLMVCASTYAPNPSGKASLNAGRVYIYNSASAGGWTLGQIIDSPYSGSQFHSVTQEKNEYFGGVSSPAGSGASHFGAKPAMKGNIIAVGAPMWDRHQDSGSSGTLSGADPTINTSGIYGAVVVLSGSEVRVNQTSLVYSTQSVTTVHHLERPGGPVPFRFGGTKGGSNLRGQDANCYYKTFKP